MAYLSRGEGLIRRLAKALDVDAERLLRHAKRRRVTERLGASCELAELDEELETIREI